MCLILCKTVKNSIDYVYKEEYNIRVEKWKRKECAVKKDKILAYIVFPTIVGIVTGAFIFAFKVASSHVMHKSQEIYSFVRINPRYLPLLILGAALIGIISATLLRAAKECRGGGIPTAVATIRGLVTMKWAQCIFGLFGSSMLTYIVGVPLGNEGPSVQMGAAIGDGMSFAFGKKNRAWERYNMTGGASAGFAVATGAPLSGIVFALEEMHRKFSPTILIFASVSVISGTATSEALSKIFGIDTTFFDLAIDEILPLRFLWVAALIGVVCGICANLLTKVYHIIRKIKLKSGFHIPFTAKIVLIFSAVALLGFISANFIGTGHSLIEEIINGHTVWYVILIAFVIRSLLMVIANNSGVSGGLFVPTLALGAMIASLIADGLVALKVIGAEYYALLVVIGIAAFLSASSRIPLTALTFAAEALCVVGNLLPVAAGVVVAYIVVEMIGIESFTDTVIEAKVDDDNAGKTQIIVESHMKVQTDAFAIGKDVNDILWPPTCRILSIHRNSVVHHHHTGIIEEGDILHLHYSTYEPERALERLCLYLGDQSEDSEAIVHVADGGDIVPVD